MRNVYIVNVVNNVMKKLMISFVFLVVLSGFVMGGMTLNSSDGSYDVEVEVFTGWNIVAATLPVDGLATDSEIQLSDIGAAWLFTTKFGELSPTGEYVRAYPDPDMDRINQADDTEMIRNAMWIYVKKDGVLKYNTLETYKVLDSRNLWQGWNFVTITPDMTIDINAAGPEEEENYVLNAMKGNCDLIKVYAYSKDGGEMKWMDLLNNPNFMDAEPLDNGLAGMGLVIKVSGDCKLGRSIIPPGLPGEDIVCTDSDGGLNASVFGNVYVKVGDFEMTNTDSCVEVGYSELRVINESGYHSYEVDSCANPVVAKNIGDRSISGSTKVSSCTGVDCYVDEQWCGESGMDGDADEFIFCSNGCSNGACN